MLSRTVWWYCTCSIISSFYSESKCNHQLRYFEPSLFMALHYTHTHTLIRTHTDTKFNRLEVFQSHVQKTNKQKKLHASDQRWGGGGGGGGKLIPHLCRNRRWQNNVNTHGVFVWHKTSIRPHMINSEKPNGLFQRRDIQCFSGSTR